jgi:hypothetical protein
MGVRAGRIINHCKIAKHFTLTINDGFLEDGLEATMLSGKKNFW